MGFKNTIIIVNFIKNQVFVIILVLYKTKLYIKLGLVSEFFWGYYQLFIIQVYIYELLDCWFFIRINDILYIIFWFSIKSRVLTISRINTQKSIFITSNFMFQI